jgi:leucyl aminopeptidase
VTAPLKTAFVAIDSAALAAIEGRIAVLVGPEGAMDPVARRLDRLMRGALARLVAGDAFAKAKPASGHVLAWPAGLAAEAVQVVKLARRPTPDEARRAGAAIAGFNTTVPLTVLAGTNARAADLALGIALRADEFTD